METLICRFTSFLLAQYRQNLMLQLWKNKFLIWTLACRFLRGLVFGNRQKQILDSLAFLYPKWLSRHPKSTWLQYTSSLIPKLPHNDCYLSCKNWVSWQGGRGTKWITISLPATVQDRHFYRQGPACCEVKQIGSAFSEAQCSLATLKKGLRRLMPTG